MATAVSLTQAAEQAWDNLSAFAIAGTLRTRILAFCTTCNPLFPQSAVATHSVANWLAILHAFGTTMGVESSADAWPLLRIAADYVYRTCFMGEQFLGTHPVEWAAMLAAYNANF